VRNVRNVGNDGTWGTAERANERNGKENHSHCEARKRRGNPAATWDVADRLTALPPCRPGGPRL
jgi:hypothetical protein